MKVSFDDHPVSHLIGHDSVVCFHSTYVSRHSDSQSLGTINELGARCFHKIIYLASGWILFAMGGSTFT